MFIRLIFYSWLRAVPVWWAFARTRKGLGTTLHRPDGRGHRDPRGLEHLATNPLKGQALAVATTVLLHLDFLQGRKIPHDVGPFGLLFAKCKRVHELVP